MENILFLIPLTLRVFQMSGHNKNVKFKDNAFILILYFEILAVSMSGELHAIYFGKNK